MILLPYNHALITSCSLLPNYLPSFLLPPTAPSFQFHMEMIFCNYIDRSTEENGQVHTNSASISDAQRWKIARANVPFAPDWSRRRALPLQLSLSTSTSSYGNVADEKAMAVALNTLPNEVQEQRLLEDLLSLMLGMLHI
jgi:hypothetical protein